MRSFIRVVVAVALVCGWLNVANAEVQVELSAMHICCGACARGIEKAVQDLPGVKVTVDKGAATTTIVAENAAAAEKAIAAIAAAGFHGESDKQELAMKDDSGASSGKVARLELTNIHNCCGGCCKAAKEAVKGVAGVSGDSLKPKETTFVVEGSFSPAAVITALNDAGFHVKIVK
ncbi:MAG TPA: cation transporter [Pirellulales bacterium]|nr:cation transporter [Pirellulales bacterium]